MYYLLLKHTTTMCPATFIRLYQKAKNGLKYNELGWGGGGGCIP